ncbi:uncharacterized protein [Choristoneura fumiferana]|uniref:uncharacterized protein n=1 Tax=Choristoneura fumiferana TaxID=7141 RepID=UPI003D15A8E9
MCDFRTYSHELLTEFIEAFRNNPCLWKIRSNDYKDKNLKLQAYNNLLEIIRKVERDATIENVKKKINSLRAGFRKEHKKVQDSKKTGSGTDQVYVPKLWYYSQLEFLKDQGQGEQSTDNIDSSEQETANDNENTFDAEHSENDTQSTICNVSSPATPATSAASSARRKRHGNAAIEDTISLIGKRLQNPDDEYDAIGKNVVIKLRNMTAIQQGIAEKLINEVIFLRRFEKLTFNTSIHNPVPVQVPQRPLIHMPAVPVQLQETSI